MSWFSGTSRRIEILEARLDVINHAEELKELTAVVSLGFKPRKASKYCGDIYVVNAWSVNELLTRLIKKYPEVDLKGLTGGWL